MHRPSSSQPRSFPSARSRPALAALVALVVAALAVTGCVSMPTGGPVLPSPVTQGTDAPNQPYVQIQPQGPGINWNPKEIVQGFLTASASYGTYPQVAEEYLTPAEQKAWNPLWSAIVYKTGPDATELAAPTTAKNQTATVQIAGTIQASLQGNGTYSVPSSSGAAFPPQSFTLTKVGSQWRISSAPLELLLTANSFENDFQLRNLYFFDPTTKFLVPDPVYVPVLKNSGVLMKGLVNELITQPPDWLSGGATKTAIPHGTNVSGVTLDGVTAVVNLTGTAIGKAPNNIMAEISSQLYWTLSVGAPSGSTGQGVQSVELVVNRNPWKPPDDQGDPVQNTPEWKPAFGLSNQSKQFYYVTDDGELVSRTAGGKPTSIARIGPGYSQIAVSADGNYLAALRGSTLYAGLIDGPLTKRGSGFAAVSWDPSDDLWASQGQQIVMFRGTPGARQPLAQTVQVDVRMVPGDVVIDGPFTELQVAPDGVRVALVMNGNALTFGAISFPPHQHPRITLSLIQETPFTQGQPVSASVGFTALAWYGPDYVITLAQPGPFVTEYPVSGGTPTPIQAVQHMDTIAASAGQPLIAGLSKGGMMSDPSITGSWAPVNDGNTPAKGSSPTYPG